MPKKIPDWKDKKPEKDKHKGVKGKHDDKPKAPPATPHQQITPATNLPQGLTVDNLRVDGDLDLSIFDDLQPDQDFMIMPSAPTQDHVYTVNFDPISGKQVVAATDPVTIVTAPPDYSEVTSDGGTPSTPSITLVSGPGWIKVTWAASTGTSDPLYYKVFARAGADPTTADDTYLVTNTQDLESVVNKLTGGTQLATGTTYHFAVKAYSRVAGGGTSAASAVVTGTPAVVDASVTTLSNLNASTITTGTLSAAFISSGTLSATVTISGTIQTASSGARVTLDNTNGLRVFDGGATDYGAGAGVTIKLPISGDPFIRGTIKALSLSLRTDSGASTINSVRWLDPTTAAELGYIMVGDNGAGAAPQGRFVVHPDDDTGSGNIDIIAASELDYESANGGLAALTLASPNDGVVMASTIKAWTRDNVDPTIEDEILIKNSRGQSDLQHIGEIMMWPHVTSIPAGWLECNGAELDVNDYAELYEAVAPRVQCTMTIDSPGVINPLKRDTTWGGLGNNIDSGLIEENTPIVFSTTGALPTGITAGTTYYVKTTGVGAAQKFTISATPGGAAINTTGSQSGTHYFRPIPFGIGSGTFFLPDFTGAFPVGRDGATFAYEGKTGGEETHALTTAELATHTHTFTGDALAAHGHTISGSTANNTTTVADGNGGTLYRASGAGGLGAGSTVFARQGGSTQQLIAESHLHGNGTLANSTTSGGTPSGTNANAGSDTAHNNLPPYLTVLFIICAKVLAEPTYTS